MSTHSVEGMRLDSHKMIYHPAAVADYLEGKQTWPINVEIGLSGACNHRCYFCAFEYLDYKPDFLETDMLLENIRQMHDRGLKSILFAGFGEPLIHKDAAVIIHETKKAGVDAALSTNGVLFHEKVQETCLGDLSWIRFSVAAPTDSTYEQIHQCRKGDLQTVIHNIAAAATRKARENLAVTLGVQMLILPESVREIPAMAKLAREIGADYLSVKPFNQGHKVKRDKVVDAGVLQDMYLAAKEQENESFKVMMRSNLMRQHTYAHPKYDRCGMLEFYCTINADGNVIPCNVFPGIDEFVYGNLNQNTFAEIWQSERCRAVKKRINEEVFDRYCTSEDCKMRMQNEYLYQLTHPHAHVNFI